MKIAQISDLHFTQVCWNPFQLLSKRIFGTLNWALSRKNLVSHDPLDQLPALFSELQVDLILWGGDFTSTGLKKEYERARSFVEKFSQNWIAIPGNHDHYTYCSWRQKRFYQFFSNKKRNSKPSLTDKFLLSKHGIEAHLISPHWWLIALDVTRPTHVFSSQGFFSKTLETHFSEILAMLPPNDKVICLSHYPFFSQESSRRDLNGGKNLQKLLEESSQIYLYLHGHTHRHAIADLQSNKLPVLLDSGCPITKNGGTWNLIELFSDHCEVTGFKWNDKWISFCKENLPWANKPPTSDSKHQLGAGGG